MTIVAFLLFALFTALSAGAWWFVMAWIDLTLSAATQWGWGAVYGHISMTVLGGAFLLVTTHVFLVMSAALILDGENNKKSDWVVELFDTPVFQLYQFFRPTRAAGS